MSINLKHSSDRLKTQLNNLIFYWILVLKFHEIILIIKKKYLNKCALLIMKLKKLKL